MELRNKRTNKIHKVHNDYIILFIKDEDAPHDPEFYKYDSLEKLNKDWEDLDGITK